MSTSDIMRVLLYPSQLSRSKFSCPSKANPHAANVLRASPPHTTPFQVQCPESRSPSRPLRPSRRAPSAQGPLLSQSQAHLRSPREGRHPRPLQRPRWPQRPSRPCSHLRRFVQCQQDFRKRSCLQGRRSSIQRTICRQTWELVQIRRLLLQSWHLHKQSRAQCILVWWPLLLSDRPCFRDKRHSLPLPLLRPKSRMMSAKTWALGKYRTKCRPSHRRRRRCTCLKRRGC